MNKIQKNVKRTERFEEKSYLLVLNGVGRLEDQSLSGFANGKLVKKSGKGYNLVLMLVGVKVRTK
jgi:hypothetical protein